MTLLDHVPPTNGHHADDVGSAVAELDRQVERGSLFTQAVLQRTASRISQAEQLLGRLIGALAAKEVVSADELGFQAEEPPAEEEAPAGPSEDAPDPSAMIAWPSIAIRVTERDAQAAPEVAVDCEARMHVCQAVCCRLKFPLSAPEIEGGKVKWDLGHPYVIRHESSGYCTHNDPETRGCRVYEDRPAVCRRYSCANDARIWTDFENMVLNQEWIDQHLARRDFYFEEVATSMDVPVTLTTKEAARAGSAP